MTGHDDAMNSDQFKQMVETCNGMMAGMGVGRHRHAGTRRPRPSEGAACGRETHWHKGRWIVMDMNQMMDGMGWMMGGYGRFSRYYS